MKFIVLLTFCTLLSTSQMRFSITKQYTNCSLFLQCCAAHSFGSVLYATANLSVQRLSVTFQYCVKTRECTVMQSSPSCSPVCLVLWCQEWSMGDDPCLGNICVLKGRPPAKTVELYTFRLITPEPLWIAEKVQLSQTES